MQLRRHIRRQPRQEEIERVAVRREADGQAPYLSAAQQVTERRAALPRLQRFLAPAARGNIVAFRVAEARVATRRTIVRVEEQKEQEAQAAGEVERPAPAELGGDDRDERNRDARPELRGRIEDRGREPALGAWEPRGDGLCVPGNVGASPTPSSSRDPRKLAKPPASPDQNDAMLQISAPIRPSVATPYRSSATPTGICSAAYV